MTRTRTKPKATTVRCAVYTRKSTEEGLDQEFNTLASQREYAESYIKSQTEEGWVCLPDHYDDGGFSGGNMARPALQRLLADIEAGKVDCIVVYKIDRLSRSLLDFSKMMEVFERHHVSFVSVTQQFNTANSMGRLMLNVLLSFAQFEREMISERTRDKIAATRRKGKWSGGMPLLGYDVVDTKLVVNEGESEIVRQIFDLYLELGSLLLTVQELARRGWTTKRWTTKRQTSRGGLPFTKGRLYHLLTNVTYIGRVRYKDEVHLGEHEAIVDATVFEKVQALLQNNGQTGGSECRNKHGALLRGILHCATCNCGMTHAFTTKRNRRYRYYVCNKAQQQGWDLCPAPSVPAEEIEQFVVDEIKAIGRDPGLVAATVAESRRLVEGGIKRLKAERTALERQSRADDRELCRLATAGTQNGDVVGFALIQERIGAAERRRSEIDQEISRLVATDIEEKEVASALREFDAVWAALKPREQARVLTLLIERVDHDGAAGAVVITFQPTGVKALAAQVGHQEETAA
jgi:site-specific DNA recombinase